MAGDPKLLTISTAAKRLGISQGTLRGYAEKGIVPVITLPSGHRRFKPEDIQRLRAEWGLDEPEPEKEQDA
jgi:excisionase family DNA binding protein